MLQMYPNVSFRWLKVHIQLGCPSGVFPNRHRLRACVVLRNPFVVTNLFWSLWWQRPHVSWATLRTSCAVIRTTCYLETNVEKSMVLKCDETVRNKKFIWWWIIQVQSSFGVFQKIYAWWLGGVSLSVHFNPASCARPTQITKHLLLSGFHWFRRTRTCYSTSERRKSHPLW